MAKRRMSAKQRKFFGKRKSVSTRKVSAGKVRRKSSSKSMLPLNMEQHLVSFTAGSVIGPLSQYLKPVQQKYLGNFGQYSDEAAIGIASWIGWKYGGKVHPKVKQVSKEIYRGAVFSTGQQAGSGLVGQLLGKFTSRNAVSGNGTRTLR